MDTNNRVVIAGGGWVAVEEGIGDKWAWKKYNKNNEKIKEKNLLKFNKTYYLA